MADEYIPDAEILDQISHLRMIQGCTCEPGVIQAPMPFGGYLLHLKHESHCQYLCRINAQWN